MSEQAVPPFDVPLEALRRRTSEKWRRYPADVLPLFVAEMDVVPPEPVVRAVHDALTSGDTGYEGDRGYVEAFAGFADERWGWAVDPGTARLVPDVMQGVAKATVFGLALSIISCHQGFYAAGGAKGVGHATTRAVVSSFVTILILDYFLTDIWLVVFPKY